MNRELRQRPARRAVLVPAPHLGGELERALVREIRLDEADASKLAGIDRLAHLADARHQARAMADRDGHAMGLLQRLDLESFLERAGDRLLGVDVLARLRHLAR